MGSFEDLLTACNFQSRDIKPEIDTEEIENVIGFNLPDDYKTFLNNYEAFEGFIGSHFLNLWSIDDLLKNNEDYDIINSLDSTIGIGSNGAGEFIAIEQMGEGIYRVVLSPLIDLDEEYHIEIGTSFHDMLLRLHNGTEWFSED